MERTARLHRHHPAPRHPMATNCLEKPFAPHAESAEEDNEIERCARSAQLVVLSHRKMWCERKLRATSQLGGDLGFGSVPRPSLSRR